MAAASLSTVPYLYKTLWPQERVENEVYDDNPFLALVPKDENFVGDSLYLALRYADSRGRSATFSTAQANKNPHKGVRFNLTRGHDYALFDVDHESILAAKKDKGALIRLLDTEMGSALNALTRSLAIALYQDGSGTRGQIDTNDPGVGTTFTLANLNDVTNFEVGMSIVFAATATGALRAGGARTVSAVNRGTGVITVSAAIDAAVGASDFVIAEGDAANGGSIILPTGLLGWIPSSDPGATAFFGVDRTPDVTRLGGIRVDESALNPEEGLAACLALMSREGAKPSHVMRNPIDYKNLQVALGSKVETEYMEVGEIGFTAIRVNGPKGQVRIVADQNCPGGRGFALTMKTLKFYSLEKAPMTIEADGQSILRNSTTDTFEGRMAYYANLGCTAPGWNANETLPS